jgi:DNA-binding MarR family transcriptional regulator
MAVKTRGASAESGIEEQFTVLASLLTQTVRSLRAGDPPPVVLRDAKERGSLTKRHLPALLTVTFCGPLGVSELAGRLGVGLSTTSALVGDLSRAGLLARSEDEADHRRTIVQLDGRHADAIATWARDALAPLRRTLERLTPAGRDVFLEGWRILHEEAALAAERKAISA